MEAVVAAAWRRRPAWRRRQQLGKSMILVAAAVCWEARWQRGDGGGNAALAMAAWRMRTIIATVTMTAMIDY